jgi:hypothetical protein
MKSGNDDILKWNIDINNCSTCEGQHDCYKHHEGSNTCQVFGHMYYANAIQIKEKMADAEAGNHPWVRGNTLFVCDHSAHCDKDYCEMNKPYRLAGCMSAHCCDIGAQVYMVPYRGDKSEKVTWPGRTDEDYSEVESFPKWGDELTLDKKYLIK